MPALRRSPLWRFVITDLDLATIVFLDKRATQRTVTYALKQATEIDGRVPGDDPEINLPGGDGEPRLAEGTRLLIGLRREGGSPPWKARAAGLLLSADRKVEDDVPYVDFKAWDPRKYLYSRPVRAAVGSTYPLPGPSGLEFKATRGNTILLDLIARTVAADGAVFIDTLTGTIEDTDPIDITFQQGSSVGDAIDQLEATGTMDVLLPALYDPFGSPGNIAQLNVYQLAGTVRNGAVMAYDLPSRSISAIDWLEDGTERANNVEMYTTNGIATTPVFDAASVAKYGTYYAQQNFPVQAQVSALEAEAGAQLLLRKDHPTTLHISPVPQLAPVPLTEYGIADWFPAYASSRLGKQLAGLFRVYEMPLVLDDDTTERVQTMLISANQPPAG